MTLDIRFSSVLCRIVCLIDISLFSADFWLRYVINISPSDFWLRYVIHISLFSADFWLRYVVLVYVILLSVIKTLEPVRFPQMP